MRADKTEFRFQLSPTASPMIERRLPGFRRAGAADLERASEAS